MKRKYKAITVFLVLLISEMTSIKANAQSWDSNDYYWVRNSDNIEDNKELDEMDFEYQLVMNQLTYKDLCCFYLDTGQFSMGDVWFPIAIYTSADRAINQVDAVEYEKFYLPIANAKIKDAYQLINGIPSLIEDINMLDKVNKDNLSFSLVQIDSDGNEQIVGYINGKDMVAMAIPSMNSYGKKKELTKID